MGREGTGAVIPGPARGAVLNTHTKVYFRLWDRLNDDYKDVAGDYSSAALYVAEEIGSSDVYLNGIAGTLGSSASVTTKGLITFDLSAAQIGTAEKRGYVYDLQLVDSDGAVTVIRGEWNTVKTARGTS